MVLDTALCAVQSVVLHGGFKWVKYCEYRSSKLCVSRYGVIKDAVIVLSRRSPRRWAEAHLLKSAEKFPAISAVQVEV